MAVAAARIVVNVDVVATRALVAVAVATAMAIVVAIDPDPDPNRSNRRTIMTSRQIRVLEYRRRHRVEEEVIVDREVRALLLGTIGAAHVRIRVHHRRRRLVIAIIEEIGATITVIIIVADHHRHQCHVLDLPLALVRHRGIVLGGPFARNRPQHINNRNSRHLVAMRDPLLGSNNIKAVLYLRTQTTTKTITVTKVEAGTIVGAVEVGAVYRMQKGVL